MDLDWEYPVSGGTSGVIHRPQDKQNFTLLLKAIRQKLDQQARKDGRDYRLTIAGAAGSGYLNCIEPQAVAQVVDHIFLMTYDFYGPWSSRSGFNAPLYAPSGAQSGSVDNAVTTWAEPGRGGGEAGAGDAPVRLHISGRLLLRQRAQQQLFLRPLCHPTMR